MGAFIVQQPNGLYCRFSTVVDCPTDWNMTREQYRELMAEKARYDADFTIEHYLRPFEWLEEYFIPNNMTRKEFEACLKEMQEPVSVDSSVTPMTPEEFAAEMRRVYDECWNVEEKDEHAAMDNLMCSLLRKLGYGDAVDIFENTHKWYA